MGVTLTIRFKHRIQVQVIRGVQMSVVLIRINKRYKDRWFYMI